MMQFPPQWAIVAAIVYLLVLIAYCKFNDKMTPKLETIIAIILSVGAIFNSGLLLINILFQDLNLGDVENFKEVISLGCVAVIWVSFTALKASSTTKAINATD
ncbi:hypothetical protein [Thalassotalea sp. ND16A]|uniref:hypothetical protein n=1 Tax=Thalassotalea sp. ND16A TaxID=1535422 RepID=UPI00051A0699|nr:hypothetical protein [Thalassotalea sp. ND16A]KGJ88103.1 hypothetical protein ND16A_2656 [Thalassotalea sp. ND16A]